MQTIAAGLQTEFEKNTSSPERVFNYQGVDKSAYVESYGNVTRRADSITSGNLSVQINNSDQSWNGILSSPSSHLSPGVTASTLQIGYTGIGFITLFTGTLDDANFPNVENIGLSFKDKFAYFSKIQVGSSQIPADYYSSASYTVFTNSNWSAGRNPADILWHLLTYWGGLDSTESSANTDIDWDAFDEFRDTLSAIGYLVQGRFMGTSLLNAIKEITDICLASIFSESAGKIVCRYWLGSDTSSIQTYTSAKWMNEVPEVDINRLDIINRYEVFYGLTFPQLDSGTASAGTTSTLTDGTKTWTVDAYRDKILHITGNTGVGQNRRIGSNTGTILTLTFPFTVAPDATSTYEILDYDASAFAGNEVNEDSTSKTNYGTFTKVVDSDNVWYYDSSSADGYGERALIDTKDPIQYVKFTSDLQAYRQQLWDALYLTESFYSWTNQGFRVESLSFNTDNGEVEIEGRLTTLYHFLILDHATFGQIDSVNVLA